MYLLFFCHSSRCLVIFCVHQFQDEIRLSCHCRQTLLNLTDITSWNTFYFFLSMWRYFIQEIMWSFWTCQISSNADKGGRNRWHYYNKNTKDKECFHSTREPKEMKSSTKLRMFNSNTILVLLYVYKTWKTTKIITKNLNIN